MHLFRLIGNGLRPLPSTRAGLYGRATGVAVCIGGLLLGGPPVAYAQTVRMGDVAGDVNSGNDVKWVEVAHTRRRVGLTIKVHNLNDFYENYVWFNLDGDRAPERTMDVYNSDVRFGRPNYGWNIPNYLDPMRRCERETRIRYLFGSDELVTSTPRFCFAGRQRIRVAVAVQDSNYRHTDWVPSYQTWGPWVHRN